LPQLITGSLWQYEDTATSLAQDPVRLSRIREALANNRASTALFDTALYTKNLEAAYEWIHDRHHSGAAPEHVNGQLAD
jgi:predicted O-linked N-acetylglucosamine transferase (SPINDLY family)